MKKRLLLMLVCLFALLASRGQLRTAEDVGAVDSTLNVVGYFCKNDTMVYLRTLSQTRIQKGDTTQNLVLSSSRYSIIVRDSTADGYTMEYIPMDIDFGGCTATSMKCKIDSIMSKLLAGVNVVFTTDDMGKITGVVNWKEVRDSVNARLTPVFDALYAAIPEISKSSSRSKLEGVMRMGLLTEAGVLSNFKEITKLFNLHGIAFSIGTTNVVDSVKDNSTVSVMAGYLPEKDALFMGDYNIIGHTVTRLSATDVSAMMAGISGTFFTDSLANETNRVFRDSLRAEMTIHDLEDYNYFYNGWPQLMRTQRIVEYYTEKRIDTDEIEWISYSWPNNYATEDEGDKAKL